MRVLLDECVPKRLGRHLAPHECKIPAHLGLGWNQERTLACSRGKGIRCAGHDGQKSFISTIPSEIWDRPRRFARPLEPARRFAAARSGYRRRHFLGQVRNGIPRGRVTSMGRPSFCFVDRRLPSDFDP